MPAKKSIKVSFLTSGTEKMEKKIPHTEDKASLDRCG